MQGVDLVTKTGPWLVYQDEDGSWGAEHTTKTGCVAGSDDWSTLLVQMLDAEQLWDAAAMARSAGA